MSYLATTVLTERNDRDALSSGTRAYFRARQKNRLYHLVMSKFRERQDAEGLTKAQLARRMGKKPEVVNRLLAAPGNWELDTLSDLLLAIAGEELNATSSNPADLPPQNSRSADVDAVNFDIKSKSSTGGKMIALELRSFT
jgi:hypothetical protein